MFPLIATIEDDVQLTNIKQSLNKQDSKCNSIHRPEQRDVADTWPAQTGDTGLSVDLLIL